MEATTKKLITRREFILRVAQVGGSAYAAMVALGLLKTPLARSFSLAGQVEGKRVIILGAGLAGLCAAYELGKLGYDCQVLEARTRVGGRCWTVRRGTKETEIGGEPQVAQFDEGLYFNPGPARIPQHHHVTLNYCKEFGLAVEVFTNANEGAYYYHEGENSLHNRRVRIREAKADMRGYVSELLAKAINQDGLDLPLTLEDRRSLTQFLVTEGGLTPDQLYKGSPRRGYATPPSSGLQPGKIDKPFSLNELIQSGFGYYFSEEYDFHQQMTMLQIAGGTDQLAKAFEKRVEDRILYEAEVKEIRQTPEDVRIVYAQKKSGALTEIQGDFCICTIPLVVLRDIPADFSAKMQRAIRAVEYMPTGKIGLQFSRRFWEEDDRIFGGISRTNLDITQIWYPSSGYLSQKGILVGCYNFAGNAITLGRLLPAERETYTLKQGRKIHPQYDDTFENSFSVSWHKIQYSLGGWALYSEASRNTHYPALNEPDDRIYLAGEHLSYLPGWMAGALESAQRVATAIHERVLSE